MSLSRLFWGPALSCSQTCTYLHRKWGPPSSFKLPASCSSGKEFKPPCHGRSQNASETKIKNRGLHRRSAFLSGWKRRKGSHTAYSNHKCLSLQKRWRELATQPPHFIINYWKITLLWPKRERVRKSNRALNEAKVHCVNTMGCRRDFYCAKNPLPGRGSSN